MTESEAFKECVKAERHYREMAKLGDEIKSARVNEIVRVAFIYSQKARTMYEAIRETSY